MTGKTGENLIFGVGLAMILADRFLGIELTPMLDMEFVGFVVVILLLIKKSNK